MKRNIEISLNHSQIRAITDTLWKGNMHKETEIQECNGLKVESGRKEMLEWEFKFIEALYHELSNLENGKIVFVFPEKKQDIKSSNNYELFKINENGKTQNHIRSN